ncbi:hypothetical protein [Gilvibacter sediminis]|uniref:hypothetical protein n=1 Tax=Gilvibacter sediminis TaxID=379071 RepID=UPI002350A988|nr:hypothetical protein [Gilvibacter sediminis]MDC7998016.1 hypothetical protein [Gilvibacter sediminis]
MIKFLEKYLITNWWIPILLFGISMLHFIFAPMLTGSGFGFYLLAIFSGILLISAVVQFFKGRIFIGLFQIAFIAVPLLFLGLVTYVFVGFVGQLESIGNNQLAYDSIQPLIEEKTDLVIPDDYEVWENTIQHTEGAIDSDYSLELTLVYNDWDEAAIMRQIHYHSELESEKGVWKKYNDGYDFIHHNNEINRAEPFYFKVDTVLNEITLNLSHL